MNSITEYNTKYRIFQSNLWAKLMLFLISPFISFVISLIDPRSKSSYLIFFLFGLIFCWHLNPTHLDRYEDLFGIIDYFEYNNFSTDEILNQIRYYFTFSEYSQKEIYQNVMIWFTKLFSNNYHCFFFLVSIPWLFFFLSSLHKITDNKKFNHSIICYIILFLFVFPRDIISVQNPRYTTAVWVSIFATINYFYKEEYKWFYLLLILLTPTIHSGYWFFVILFLLFILFFNKYQNVCFVCFLISLPFSIYGYALMSSIDFTSLPLPPSLAVWINNYLSYENYLIFIVRDGPKGGFYIIGALFGYLILISYLMMAFLLWKNREYINGNHRDSVFLSFILFLYACVNALQTIPELGGRSLWTIRILIIYFWYKVIYPKYNGVVCFVFFSCFLDIARRYFGSPFQEGAVYSSVPLNIFYDNLFSLIMDFL